MKEMLYIVVVECKIKIKQNESASIGGGGGRHNTMKLVFKTEKQGNMFKTESWYTIQ